MKKHHLQFSLCPLLSCLVVLASSAQAEYAPTVLSDGPAGYWRLNEPWQPGPQQATNIGSLGDAANGAFSSVTQDQPGAIAGDADGSVTFSGVSPSTIDVAYNAALNPATFTVECWAKVTGGSSHRSPLTSRESAPSRGYIFYAMPDNTWQFWTGTGTGWDTLGGSTAVPVVNGQWVHLVGTYDGATKRFYVNGNEVNSRSVAFSPNSRFPLRFGAGATEGNGSFWFPGGVDEVAVYGAALDAPRILAHYQAGTSGAGDYESTVLADNPLGYWRLGEVPLAPPPPITATNSGILGASADGLYFNSHTNLGVAGALVGDPDTAVLFETAKQQKIDVPYSPGLNTSNFSFEVWAKVLGGQGSYRSPITSRDDQPQRGYILYASSANKWEFWSGTGQQVGWHSIVGPNVVLGEWAHVVGTYDGTYKRFYVNGALVGVARTVIAPNTVRPTRIGAGSTDKTPGEWFFNGVIDEAAVYDKALTPDQVLGHYTNGAAANPPPVAPAIVSAPADPVTVLEGSNVTFIVQTTGSLPLRYQWQLDGVNLPEATNDVLSLPDVMVGQSGLYTCTISNVAGVVSTNINLTVELFPPGIVVQPASQTLYEGGTAMFYVGVTGGVHFAYQWFHIDAALPDATNDTLVIPGVSDEKLGDYFVIVTNAAGSATSELATLNMEFVTPDTYTSVVLADQPAAFWRLGEASGAPAAVDSYGGHYGWYSNGVTLGLAGALAGDADTSVGFDKSASNKVDVRYSAALNPGTFTVEAWAKVTGGTGTYRALVSSRDDPPTSGYIIYAGDNNRWQFWTGTGGGPGTWQTMMGPDVVVDEWVHLAGTFDGSNKVFYVNGLPVASFVTNLAVNARNPLRIGGGRNELPTGDYFFQGQIDEVAVFGTALSPSRIADHFAAGRGRLQNAPPVASGDNAAGVQDRPVVLALEKLLANDTDPDGDPVSVLSVSASSTNGGLVALEVDSVTYTPVAGYVGTDLFTYTITDGFAGTSTASVVISLSSSNALSPNVVYGPVVRNGEFIVRFAGVPGYAYTIEYTDIVEPSDWRKAVNVVAPTADEGHGIGIFEFMEPSGDLTNRFYRTVYPAY